MIRLCIGATVQTAAAVMSSKMSMQVSNRNSSLRRKLNITRNLNISPGLLQVITSNTSCDSSTILLQRIQGIARYTNDARRCNSSSSSSSSPASSADDKEVGTDVRRSNNNHINNGQPTMVQNNTRDGAASSDHGTSIQLVRNKQQQYQNNAPNPSYTSNSSNTNTNTKFSVTKHKKTPQEIRDDAIQFIERVEEYGLSFKTHVGISNPFAEQAKYVLLDIVTCQQSYKNDGQIASRLLNSVLAIRPPVRRVNGTITNYYDKEKIILVKLHSLVMQIWIRSKHYNTHHKVEEIYWKLINNTHDFLLYDEKNKIKNTYIINDLFCLTINSLTQTVRRATLSTELSIRVNNIIDAMEALWKNNIKLIGPNTASYNVILLSLMKQRKYNESIYILQTMIQEWTTNKNQLVKPNQTSFDSTIVACSKSGQPELAYTIIQLMIQLHTQYPNDIPFPGPYNFTDLLVGFARCHDDIVNDDNDDNDETDTNTNTNVPSTVQEDNAVSVTNATTAAANNTSTSTNNTTNSLKKLHTGQRAEEILRWIEELHNNGQYNVIDGQNSMTYNINLVLHAWVTSEASNSAQRVHTILYNMLQKFPKMKSELENENNNDNNNDNDKEYNNEVSENGPNNTTNTMPTTTKLVNRTNTNIVYADAISFWTVAHAWNRHAQRTINDTNNNETIDNTNENDIPVSSSSTTTTTTTTLVSNEEKLKIVQSAIMNSMEVGKWATMYMTNNIMPLNHIKIKETYEEIIRTCIIPLELLQNDMEGTATSSENKQELEDMVQNNCNQIIHYMKEHNIETDEVDTIIMEAVLKN